MIHPTAIVDDTAQIADGCTIGAYCVIEKNVTLGHRVILDSHVVLKSGTVIGDDVYVHSHAVIGDDPQIVNQDFSFESGVSIGARTVIREGVTIHRASQAGQQTSIGSDCLLMAFSHVGHDTHVGNHCILVNQVLLAGCVTVQDYAFLSGGSMIHQFVHIGESAFVSGNAEITMHVPPFVTVLGRNQIANLNVVGLKRRGFSSQEVADIKQLYRLLYNGDTLSFKKRAEMLLEEGVAETEKGQQFLKFFVDPKTDRGFVYDKH